MATTKEKKINEIGKSFGMALWNMGSSIVRSSYHLEPKEYSSTAIKSFLSVQTGIGGSQISCADGKYSVVSWEDWEWIKDKTLIDEMIYYSNTRDCDNFSFHFASTAGALFRLNSCGVAFGQIITETGRVGYHAFNMIVVEGESGLELYLYEPLNDDFCKWKKGKKNILPTSGWIYKPKWLIFF